MPTNLIAQGWSACAHFGSGEAATVVGDRLVAVVSGVHQRSRLDDGPGCDARPHVVELLVSLLGELSASPTAADASLETVTNLIGAVHDDCRRRPRRLIGEAAATVLIHDGDHLSVVHIGDGAAYRLRVAPSVELTALTREHTLAAELRAHGRHPNARAARALTRVIGGADGLAVDVTRLAVEPGRTRYVVVSSTPGDLHEMADLVARPHDLGDLVADLESFEPARTGIVVEVDA